MNKKLLGIYVIGLHLLLAVVLVKSNFTNKLFDKVAPEASAEITPYQRTVATFYRRMDGSVPAGATVFIGDSITQGLAVAAVAQPSVNYGIGLDSSAAVLARLGDYQSLQNAKAIVLAIGVNDLKWRENTATLANFELILQQLPKHVPVVVSAVLPVDEQVSSVTRRNQQIIELNAGLQQLVTEFANVHYLDAGKNLANAQGNLAAQFHVGDGVHLNTQGYEVWIAELKAALALINRDS